MAEAPTPLAALSSQARSWRRDTETLATERARLNDEARQRIAATTSAPSDADIYLSPADELLLVGYYLEQLAKLCNIFQYPQTVLATATTYMKRFYLRNTCMDYHPKNVMLTCLFLASKTENQMRPIGEFVARIPGGKTTERSVLDLEFVVCQGLRFQFKVHHAHTAAQGILLDMQTTGVSSEALEKLRGPVDRFIRTSRLTDAEFLHAASHIAVAAFLSAGPAVTRTWLEEKQRRTSSDAAAVDIAGLESLIAAIEARQAQPVDVSVVRAVDLRLKACLQASASARKLEEPRPVKAVKPAPSADPFGAPL